MIRPMFGFRPKPKKFDYQYRYYDPEKDEREKRKKRIKFETHNQRRPAQFTRDILPNLIMQHIVQLL